MIVLFRNIHPVALALMVLASLLYSSAADARPTKTVPFFSSQPAPGPSRDLKRVIRPQQFFRQASTGDCADQGGMVLCRFTFLTIPANQSLRVSNVSCGGPVDAGNVIQFFILSTTPDFDTLNPVAVIPASQTIDLDGGVLILANQKGPYYFAAAETVYILSGGSLQSSPTCIISGELFATN